MDSIRAQAQLGRPANRAANDWLVRTYKSWGIDVKNEQYGTWRDWTRGPSGLQLLAPRVRVLEATMHAWSASTPAGGVTADVVMLPSASEVVDSAGFVRWLAGAKGKLVLASMPQPTCRPDSDIKTWADSGDVSHAVALRDSVPANGLRGSLPLTSARATSRWFSSAPESPGSSRTRGHAGGASTRSKQPGSARSRRSTSRARTTACWRDSPPTASIHASTPWRRDARTQRVAGVQHDRAHPGIREAE